MLDGVAVTTHFVGMGEGLAGAGHVHKTKKPTRLRRSVFRLIDMVGGAGFEPATLAV
jgi:hypothetical protein